MPSSYEQQNSGSSYPPNRRYAPWYDFPSSPPSVVSIAHPCIIQNVDKGLQTLGGDSAVSKLCEAGNDSRAKLYLRPGDRDRKPIVAANVKTDDVVLRITVPKRTGLKRKRGSEDPFAGPIQESGIDLRKHAGSRSPASGNALKEAWRLLRSLRDNEEKYDMKIVGRVEETHRFRDLPDFIFTPKDNGFMKNFRESILPFDYSKMKDFKFNKSKGLKQETDLIPPPRLNMTELPFNYNYHQNPYMKETLGSTGDPQLTLQGLPEKQLNQHTLWNTPSVPMAASDLLPDESTLDPRIQCIITEARSLFAIRPIWTRRALFNNLSSSDLKALGWNGTKHIQQYVGYSFNSGPWRDAIVRFGIDPRTDPKYRVYQTMAFQLEPPRGLGQSKGEATLIRRDWKTIAELHQRKSHIFDGQEVHTDGKTWQVCDVTDPYLSKIFATATLRDICHSKLDGWFQNGVFAKAKVIMKSKMRCILEGRTLLDEELEFFDTLPDILGPKTRRQWAFDKNVIKRGVATAEHINMLSDMRTTALRTQDTGGRYGMGYEEAEGADGEEDEDVGGEEADTLNEDDEEEEGALEEDTEAP